MFGRWLRAAAALIVVGAAAGACETDARGVEDCRDIERARCRAARYCDLGIESDEDVATCERFMRDHCLHGLETDEDVRTVDLKNCVEDIERAGECARKKDDAACVSLRARGSKATACEMIQAPEEMRRCQFLIPDLEPPEEDAGSDPDPKDAGADSAGG